MKSLSIFVAIPLIGMATTVLAQSSSSACESAEPDANGWKQACWEDDTAVIAQASSPARQSSAQSGQTGAATSQSTSPQPGGVPLQQTESEAEPQNYVGLHFGKHDVDEWQGRVDFGRNVALDGRVSLDSKWEAGLQVGREYERSRYELEYQLGRYQITAIELGPRTAAASGNGKYQALTLNAYRLKQLSERIDGYAGIGIGWGKASLPELGFSGSCKCFAVAEDTGFIWQWRLGLEYLVNVNNELFMQYSRLMNVPGPVSAATAPGVVYEEKDIDTLAIGWRMRFEADGDGK